MQKLINESMIDVCKEQGVPTEQVFFLFTVGFIVLGYLNINFLCKKHSLWKIIGFIFCGDQEKNEADFFDNINFQFSCLDFLLLETKI